MNALSDLVKYAQIGDVRYVRGDHDELYSRRNEAAAELARLQAVVTAARKLLNNLPESVIEEAREVWGNTNTRIILEARQALAAAIEQK